MTNPFKDTLHRLKNFVENKLDINLYLKYWYIYCVYEQELSINAVFLKCYEYPKKIIMGRNWKSCYAYKVYSPACSIMLYRYFC
jgi:hypothetical protein